jgi:ubiquinone/menaquinone biosynthesis C-methylase UbiE
MIDTNTTMRRTYLPAAGRDWLLPLYDPIVKLIGADATRRVLVEQAALLANQRVLEIGCGTGSLLVLIARCYPDTTVVGLDPDPKALDRARRKAQRAGASIQLDRGFADEMPYPAASFDRVFSSFMFPHLPADVKARTLAEVRRVLKPGGCLLLLDFAGHSHTSGSEGLIARTLRSSPRLHDNTEDRIVTLMRQAGFADSKKVRQDAVFFHQIRIDYYEAVAP